MSRIKTEEPKFIRGSGNVFADMGLENPEEMLLKADLAAELRQLYRASGLSQAAFGKKIGLDQARVSRLLGNGLDLFSVEKLMRLLVVMNQNVEVRIAPNKATTRPAVFKVVSVAASDREAKSRKVLPASQSAKKKPLRSRVGAKKFLLRARVPLKP